jgi:ADP-ribose pyrophosphatase YjhB (NUDIX family)
MKQFEYIVRVVAMRGNSVLLCRGKKFDWFYFPGGHIDFGEHPAKALAREMREEIGGRITGLAYMGMVENVFSDNNGKHHEINLVFAAHLAKKNVISKERHLVFTWKEKKDLVRASILPKKMKSCVIQWMKDKKIFWATNA